MPYKEPKIVKLYYTLGEIVEVFGVKDSTIRYWSDKFINPKRNNKGDRMFSPKDLDTFKIIYYLVKERGMTLEGAKKRIDENRDGESKNAEVVNRLEIIKEELLDLKNYM